MRFLCSAMLLLFVCASGVAFAADEMSAVEQYKQERIAKRAYERLLYANKMLHESGDTDVINESVQDAVRYATNKDENQRALAAIDAAMERLTFDGDAHREAMLARGKLLTRLDKRDEAESLFQNAINQKWNHAMWRYSESLIESDQMAESCIMECNRISGLEKYEHYLSEGESLEIFLTLLRLTKHHDPEISVVDDVAKQLNDITDKQHFSRIAKALCFAEDGYTDEAVALLDEIDAQLSEKKDHRDYKHLPLYKASILFKEGKNYPAAQASFTEFMKRNEGSNKKIITSALRLARDIEIIKEDLHKIDEFATFVINNSWFEDKEVRKELSDDDIAGIYDMQRLGVAWSDNLEKSAQIAKFVADAYPDTLAGVTCLRDYAIYLGYKKETRTESLRLLNEVLLKTDNSMLISTVRMMLADTDIKNKNYDKALEHLQAALDNISPYEKGSNAWYRNEIQDRIDMVIKRKAKS